MPLPSQAAIDVRTSSEEPSSKTGPIEPDAGDQEKREANALMMGGAGIGVFGVVAAAIGGAVCPVCVVAAPALLGVGAFRRWRATRARPVRG